MIIISFLLDGILSNYFVSFTFINLLINCYYKDKNYMLKEGLIFGILYDIVYTNTLILNGFLFFFLILFFYNFNRNNKYTILIILLCFIIYKIVPPLLLVFFKYGKFSFDISFISLSINLIYAIFLLLIKHKKIFSS